MITLTGVCRFEAGEELALQTPYRQVRALWAMFQADLEVDDDGLEFERAPFLEILRRYLDGRGLGIDWDAITAAPAPALINSLSMALPFETAFIKSASYLMHYTFFSAIRSLLLDKSNWILEDDTGIPYRYFPPAAWEARLYGEYTKPIELFHGVEQEDLKKAYAEPAHVRALPFHLGYHWSTNKDSILYFHKKAAAASPEIR